MLNDNKQKLYITVKTALSVGTWIIAFVMALKSGNTDTLKYILPALIFCTLGDVLLALSDEVNISLKEPYFTLGVASFGIAHVIFGFYFLTLIGFDISLSVILSPLTALLLWYFRHSGILECGRYNGSIMVYALLVGAFLGLGINLVISGGFTPKHILLCAASVLFWTSDLTLSFRYFSSKSPFTLGVIVLTTYFAAIYMIAFSICL